MKKYTEEEIKILKGFLSELEEAIRNAEKEKKLHATLQS